MPFGGGGAPGPRTRSELLAARHNETVSHIRDVLTTWEHNNPVWARRLTGPEAAKALGYAGSHADQPFASRRDMIHARRTAQRAAAFASSGFDQETQAKLTAHELGALNTQIARPTVDPSLKWVEKPTFPSRSALRAERRADNVRTLDAATEANERNGVLGAEARVQRRIDQNIAFLQQAGPGPSRANLLAERRRVRAAESQAAHDAHPVPQPALYSKREEPFWKLEAAVKPKGEYATTAADMAKSVQPTTEHATGAPSAESGAPRPSTAVDVLPNGKQSAEMLRAKQRWWTKPEVYPAVAPFVPRAEEPFKLAVDDRRYLARKLSSGAKKSQRGYPPEDITVCDKLTSQPPPSLANFAAEQNARKPFRQYTSSTFRFLPSEPREVVPGQDATNFDGYEFTQPLYSSFTADKTFRDPTLNLPPRPGPSARAQRLAARERARPSTSTGMRGAETRPMPASAPNGAGEGGMAATRPMASTMERPLTVAMGDAR